MRFENLSLHPKLLKAIDQAGYLEPTEIQRKVIPKILRGFDLQASAQTGTGKTAAFLLPTLHLLVAQPDRRGTGARVLILVPTRELATQIEKQTRKYARTLPCLQSVCIYGGVPYPAQIRQLSKPHEILIATPGRLIDLIDQKKVNVSRLKILILDEADRMLDRGFLKPVENIIAAIPSKRQTLLFSATLPKNVVALSERLLNKPMEITVKPELGQSRRIKQSIYFVDNLHHKNRLLNHLLKQEDRGHTIIFTSTKRQVDRLTQDLRDQKHLVGALHGDISQSQRSKTVLKMHRGEIHILVATDIAARGIDIKSVTHVINYDLPFNVEDYVHRIGRTGRAGAYGFACSFVASRDVGVMKKIKAFTGHAPDVVTLPGLEPSIHKKDPKCLKTRKKFRRAHLRSRRTSQ